MAFICTSRIRILVSFYTILAHPKIGIRAGHHLLRKDLAPMNCIADLWGAYRSGAFVAGLYCGWE